MTDPETRFNKLVAKLQNQNYRLTPQRMALLHLLATSEGHPNASQLYDQIKAQFPTTSLATVYKTLNVLKAMGEVLELGFRNDDNRYDGNKPYPHPHLICSQCGRILDLDLALDDVKKSKQRFVRLTKALASSYDHIFFDCPPGLSLLSENIFRASDVVLMPLIPTTLSLRTFEQVRGFFAQKAFKRKLLLPFFCLVDRRKRLHKETCDAYAGGKDGFLKTSIPYASAIELMGLRRAPLPSYDKRSRGTRAFKNLWYEVVQETFGYDYP